MSYTYRNFATKIIFKNSLWSDLIWLWKMAFILKDPVVDMPKLKRRNMEIRYPGSLGPQAKYL